MKQLNNKTLGIILVVLVALFIGTRLFRSSGDSNIRSELIQIDTSLVTRIVLYPEKQHQKRLHLIRSGSQWQVVQGSHSVPAAKGAVKSLLGTIAYVGIKRVVSRDKKDWKTYNLSDTAATHVKVYAGDQLLVDCRVGTSSKGSGPYTRTTTYVRMDSLPEVYETKGFLASVVNKDFDDWRNHEFLRLNQKDIQKLQFHYPAGSGFTAVKADSVWMIGREKADSAKMAAYLGKICSRNLSSFDDAFKPQHDPDVVISISGSGMTRISAWKQDSSWILESSQRPGLYFDSKNSGLIKDLMINKETLLSGK